MKSTLLSIKPKYVKLIASGKKVYRHPVIKYCYLFERATGIY